MWCPNCGAFVASGDFCDRCGASLSASTGTPRRRTVRNTFGKKPANANKPANNERRAGTLGDLFKSDSPFTGEQRAQKPSRSPGQTFLAWRDSRRASQPEPPSRPQPAHKPSAKPKPQPKPRPRPHHQQQAAPEPPEDRFAPFPPYMPGGQSSQLEVSDPWTGTYGTPTGTSAGADAPMQTPPPQADPWAVNRDWGVLPETSPPSGPISGSSSGWRVRAPMVKLDDEDAQWMAMPQYGQNGDPIPRSVLARRAVAHVSRLTLNAALIGLIVLILIISISIGLTHLASLSSQATLVPQANGTPVPTAPVPDSFTGYATPLFSLSYPSSWKHAAFDKQLSDGTSTHEDSFTDGQAPTVSLYTTYGTANLLQSYLDELATETAANAPLKASTQAASRTYDRAKWQERDYTYSGIVNGKAAQIQMRMLAVIQGATAYIFVLTAPQSSFGQSDSAAFEPLLDSFRFY